MKVILEYIKRLLTLLRNQSDSSRTTSREFNCVARPVHNVANSKLNTLASETVLFLCADAPFLDLARSMKEHGATVLFKSLWELRDIYALPLEQYTMVVLPEDLSGRDFDIIDISGVLRRTDPDIVLIWASTNFSSSNVTDDHLNRFCDIVLALPTPAKDLILLLKELGNELPRGAEHY